MGAPRAIRYRVGSYGVAVGEVRRGGILGGLDQTCYKAEAWALFKLMRSIAGVQGEIWVIIDNLPVMREAESRRAGLPRPLGTMPGLWRKIGELIQKCPGIHFGWVPSHAKKN